VVARDFHINRIVLEIEQVLRRSAGRRRAQLGTASQAYHLAVLAEKLTQATLNAWMT
jgi:hypothetical protein